MVNITAVQRQSDEDTQSVSAWKRLMGFLRVPTRESRKSRGPWWKPTRLTIIGMLILSVTVTLRVLDPPIIESARVKTFDLYNRIKPRTPANPSPVVIIDFDEKSLAEIGQWPWPRTVVADMIAAARDYGMAVVGFDVVFAEQDRTSPASIAESLRGAGEDTLAALRELPANEDVMAQSMTTMRTVLGQAGTKSVAVTEPTDKAMETSVLGWKGGDPNEYVFSNPTLISNVGALEETAMGRAFFSVEDELDGVVRRVPTVMNIAGAIKPTLALEMLRVGLGGNSIFIRMNEGGMQDVVLQVPGTKGFPVPTDERGRVWVYFAEPDEFNSPDNSGRLYVSAADIIKKRVPPERLQGRLGIVGTSAVGLLDIRSTPIEPRLPGVEVHANLIESIMQQTYLSHPVEMNLAEIMVTVLAGILLLITVPRLGPFLSLVPLAVGTVALVGTSWYLFSEKLLFLDASYPSGSTFALYLFLAFSNYARDAAEKRQVRGAFAQYLSPDLVEQLAENPDKLQLGGETKHMTLLFCDVRGFTTISEQYKTDPQGLTILINRLLTPLTTAILKTRGTIDKYMGDCIMAFWNAPLDIPDQEKKACDAALDMFRELEILNNAREEEANAAGTPFLPLKIGIGINTGDVVVGNMGSEQRFDYSVLGDAVNLAARLEGQSKAYGVDVIIGDTTNEAVTESYATFELDQIEVKGKTEAVRIFALLGDTEFRARAEFQPLQEIQAKFLDAYRTQNWDAAEAQAKQARSMMDGLMEAYYELFDERIAEYRETPPPADWDGVYVATTK